MPFGPLAAFSDFVGLDLYIIKFYSRYTTIPGPKKENTKPPAIPYGSVFFDSGIRIN